MVAETWTRTRWRRRRKCAPPGASLVAPLEAAGALEPASLAQGPGFGLQEATRSDQVEAPVHYGNPPRRRPPRRGGPPEDVIVGAGSGLPGLGRRRKPLAAGPLLGGYLILIGLAALLLLLLHLPAVPGQEIGEGLTLSHKSAQGQQQQQLRQRQRQHLELSPEEVGRVKAENRVSAQLGQNVILNCAVQFKDGRERLYALEWLKHPHKLPIYLWHAGYPDHKAPGYETRLQRLGLASLNLSQVRESDRGLYECHIYHLDERPEEAAKPSRLYLDVLAPPRITLEPAPVSYVQAGDSLHLTCQAESMPAPVLRWYKNKQPIDSASGAYRTSSVIAEPDQQQEQAGPQEPEAQRLRAQEDLFIDNIQAGQGTGDYRCLASNSEGSAEAHAQVILGVPAVITGPPRDQLRLEGERAEFQCQARALPANISYRWLFNDKPLQQLKWFENRHSIRRDGTLILPSVHRDDQGHYRCQASNGLSHKTPGGAPQQVSAEAGASLTVEFPARVTQSPSPQYLPLGLSGLVRCFVQAVPPVEFFTWTLNNQQFDAAADPNIERLLNGSLLIKQVTRNYRGTYRCTPFNKHGTAGSSGAMEVRVEEPPVFVARPADFYKAAAGGHVSMACEARGEPPPVVAWRRVVGHAESTASRPLKLTAGAEQPSTGGAQSDAQVGAEDAGAGSEEHELYERSAGARQGLLTPYETEADELASSEREKQSVIVYAPLPAGRSDYKNSHLLLHGLRKEDHGRYECVIENEVATLIASTMLYIEETSPHAPVNVRVEPRRWSALISWTPGYDGGFEQSFTVWYRQVSSSSSGGGQQQQPADLNWRSASVRPPDATSLEVQNLTQNSVYEFCVHAKNIIGEGPRSTVVTGRTKEALLSQLGGGQTQDSDEAGQESTMSPAIMGIIHLVDYAASTPEPPGRAPHSAAPTDSLVQLYPANSSSLAPSDQLQVSPSSTNQTSKVIKIILPHGGAQANASAAADNSTTASTTNNNSQPTNSLTAPQHLKMTKVAQGWVLSWLPPPLQATFGHPAATVAASQVLVDSKTTSASLTTTAPTTTYLLEYREKGGAWHTLVVPSSQERSMLLKDLKPGAEYLFRVYAADATGQRGAPSLELAQSIPDYRRKPGSTQALSAGVVSGMLFFIACIVIAVCTVNMCNKRRKKRAEKAAYVMMACPVLESHHDIEALNTNSLMKNAGAAQNRVSSVSYGGDSQDDRKLIDKLNSTLGRASRRLFGGQQLAPTPPPPPPPLSSEEFAPSATRCIRYSASRPALPVDVGDAPVEPAGRATTPSDDYWLLEPADSRWGTLTVATSRLAERRAREARRQLSGGSSGELGAPGRCEEQSQQQQQQQLDTASRSATQVSSDANLQSQLLFESWLAKQLAGPEAASAEPAPPEVPSAFRAALPVGASWHAGHSASFSHQRQQTAPADGWHQFQLQAWASAAADNSQEAAALLHRRANSSYLAAAAGWWGVEGSPAQVAAPLPVRLGRNSGARRTLPLAASFTGQQPPPPPPPVHQVDHQHHHKSPAAAYQQQQQQQQRYLAPGQQHRLPGPSDNLARHADDDDPVTENACFGSYKRKRRLPHIEAQFTITPPQPQPRLSGWPAGAEREALENGHLFVRPATVARSAPIPRRAPPPPPLETNAPSAGDPPGMPRPGQRSEQRRLRGTHLPQVATMGAKEKIETYLRHYDEAQREPHLEAAAAAGSEWLASLGPDCGRVLETSEQQLIFQPYSNLPSLKYTISLPLARTPDGGIILGETNELRLSKRSRRARTLTGGVPELPPALPPKNGRRGGLAGSRAHQRLGSSSSCPPRPHHQPAELPPIKRHHHHRPHLQESGPSTCQHPFDRLLALTSPLDSSINSMAGSAPVRPFYLHPKHLEPPVPDPSIDVFLNELPPPPIPPHKSSSNSLNRNQPKSGELAELGAQSQVAVGNKPNSLAFIQKKNSESSNSPHSSTSPGPTDAHLSPASSLATNQENQSGNEHCGATSEVPTNSVDENYEFDQLSSSSSSIPHLRHRRRAKRSAGNKQQLDRRQTTTKKSSTSTAPASTALGAGDLQTEPLNAVLERSQLHDYSRCKLAPLQRPEVESSHQQTPPATNYYDTVYGELVDQKLAIGAPKTLH